MSKDRPILFSAEMVRALLDGRKTQTRRVIKEIAGESWTRARYSESVATWYAGWWFMKGTASTGPLPCPHGLPGDRLWVREAFRPIYPQDKNYNGGKPIEYDYAATYQHGYRMGDQVGEKNKWKPSIHMPRAASRILLEITNVRVERVQEISEENAKAEGLSWISPTWGISGLASSWNGDPRESFRALWDSINTARGYGWGTNPWVWVIEFKRIENGNE